MKIIDEKGRLFGRINVIDFLAILFLFCLIPGLYFGYKILNRKPVASQEGNGLTNVKIETMCKFIQLEPGIIRFISVGDKQYNAKGQLIGEVIELGEVAPYIHELDIDMRDNRKIIKEDPDLKQLIVKLRLNLEVKDNQGYYQGKRYAINSPLEFRTNKYKVVMVPFPITERKSEIFEEKHFDINVAFKELDKETLSMIVKGDKEIDNKGQLIAEILDIGAITNSIFPLDLGNGSYAQVEDSYKKQIAARLRLRCYINQNNDVYFKDKKIQYNFPIEFNTGRYKIKGVITEVYMFPQPPLQEKWITLQVKFTGIIPEIAKCIRSADVEREPSGKTVGILKEILSDKPSDTLTLIDNKFMVLSHPFNKDIVTIFDFLCVEKDGIFYFKNYPAKMGNSITFTSDIYSISGVIIGMKIK